MGYAFAPLPCAGPSRLGPSVSASRAVVRITGPPAVAVFAQAGRGAACEHGLFILGHERQGREREEREKGRRVGHGFDSLATR